MEALEQHLHHQIDHQRSYFWHRIRWCAVRGYLPTRQPFTLADVGAGAGLLGEYMQRDRPLGRYSFVEPLGSLEARLEQRFGPAANLAGAPNYERCDFLCLLDVLEHQYDDRGFLAHLVARMRPGAILLVTVPALTSLWSTWDDLLGHYRRYDKRSLCACAEALPVEILETSYLFPEMWPIAAIRRLRMGREAAEPDPSAAQFPDLPAAVNGLLYGVGRISLAARRVSPFGTSLLIALRRVESPA